MLYQLSVGLLLDVIHWGIQDSRIVYFWQKEDVLCDYTELVGLALSYGLSLNQALFWTVWLACNLENKMVAVERIQQFINIPSEAPSIISNHRPAANWPSMGTIVFQNLQVSSMYY